jgi:hypothetical protein
MLFAFAQLGLGLLKARSLRDAGKAERRLAYQRAMAIQAQAERLRLQGLDELHAMEEDKQADISSSRAAAGKSGVRAGAGSTGRAEKRVAREWNRNKTLYGKQIADAIASLNSEAMLIAKGGEATEKAYKVRSTGSLLETGASFGKSAYENNLFGLFAKKEA